MARRSELARRLAALERAKAKAKAEAARLGITLGELDRRIVDQYREAKRDRTG